MTEKVPETTGVMEFKADETEDRSTKSGSHHPRDSRAVCFDAPLNEVSYLEDERSVATVGEEVAPSRFSYVSKETTEKSSNMRASLGRTNTRVSFSTKRFREVEEEEKELEGDEVLALSRASSHTSSRNSSAKRLGCLNIPGHGSIMIQSCPMLDVEDSQYPEQTSGQSNSSCLRTPSTLEQGPLSPSPHGQRTPEPAAPTLTQLRAACNSSGSGSGLHMTGSIRLSGGPTPPPLRPSAGSEAGKNRRRSLLNFFMSPEPPQISGDPPSCSPSVSHSIHAGHGSGEYSLDSFGQPLRTQSRRKSISDFFTSESNADINKPSSHFEANGSSRMSRASSEVGVSRSRRASFIDFFRTGASGNISGDNLPNTELAMPSVGRKSRRASFVDFFSSGKEMDTEGGYQSEGAMTGRKTRRASMVDLFNEATKKGAGLLRRMTTSKKLDLAEFDDDEEEHVPSWFTSLNDFRPLTFCFHKGSYKMSYFASTIKTGEHHVLKVYKKESMPMSVQRAVRRIFAFATSLEHDHIVKIKGTWETDEDMYVVEEYAVKGDLQSDFASHPDAYTEAYIATKIVYPLLKVLVYLHAQNIIHRSLHPEHILFGRDSKLLVGNFHNTVDTNYEAASDRIKFLDYMAPEMFAVKSLDDPGASMVRKETKGEDAGMHNGVGRRGPRKGRKERMKPQASGQVQLEIEPSTGNLGGEASWRDSTPGPDLSHKLKGEASLLGGEHSLRNVGEKIEVANEWEWMNSYDSKVDIWQVGVLMHELLCGQLPFAAENKLLTAALIMWADITQWPDTLSPQCIDFMQQCLTKNPKERPSAQTLLEHPFVALHVAGKTLLPLKDGGKPMGEEVHYLLRKTSELLAPSKESSKPLSQDPEQGQKQGRSWMGWLSSWGSRKQDGDAYDEADPRKHMGSEHGAAQHAMFSNSQVEALHLDEDGNEADNPFAKQRAVQAQRRAAVPHADVDPKELRRVF